MSRSTLFTVVALIVLALDLLAVPRGVAAQTMAGPMGDTRPTVFPSSNTSRTAPARNSSVKLRRGLAFHDADHQGRPTFGRPAFDRFGVV
jgi:hypothetical protein